MENEMSTAYSIGPIAVYGASGHTARFVLAELRRRGRPAVAVGRRADMRADGVPARVAAIDDPAALDAAFAGCAAVINCAGPFLDTALPVAEAAIRAGAHYIDVTAEQASAMAVFERLDAPARAAGVAVIPAAGFYGGLADLLATSLLGPHGEAAELTVAVALDRWWPTAGTRKTGERNTMPRLVVDGGRLVAMPLPAAHSTWRFGEPHGDQAMIELPFSETITISHHLRVHSLRAHLTRQSLEEIRDETTPPPAAADAWGRSAQRFEMVVRARQGAHGVGQRPRHLRRLRTARRGGRGAPGPAGRSPSRCAGTWRSVRRGRLPAVPGAATPAPGLRHARNGEILPRCAGAAGMRQDGGRPSPLFSHPDMTAAHDPSRADPSRTTPNGGSLDLAGIVAQLRAARERWRAEHGRLRDYGARELPSREALAEILEGLRGALFPMRLGPPDLRQDGEDYYVGHTLDTALHALAAQVRLELRSHARASGEGVTPALDERALAVVREFGAALPRLRELLDTDVLAAYRGDPAARSVDEVLVCYPGLHAMIHHRIAHQLYHLGVPLLARIVAELAHGATGIDIHPGASIGSHFFIDHGTGVVIGETAVIGNNVRIYQAVTLGAKRFETDAGGALHKGGARHPIVEDDVVIYAGATVLGRVTIGRGASIGGNVWLTRSVPAGSHIAQANARDDRVDDGASAGR
jgi:serine O-acetyltransferase